MENCHSRWWWWSRTLFKFIQCIWSSNENFLELVSVRLMSALATGFQRANPVPKTSRLSPVQPRWEQAAVVFIHYRNYYLSSEEYKIFFYQTADIMSARWSVEILGSCKENGLRFDPHATFSTSSPPFPFLPPPPTVPCVRQRKVRRGVGWMDCGESSNRDVQ